MVHCAGQPVLPVGLKDDMGFDTVKVYCPKCNQIYHPPPIRSKTGSGSGVDGAAFGTTFPHLFLMTFSNLVPDPLTTEATYVPRVFGFRVHKSARQRNTTPPVSMQNTIEIKSRKDSDEDEESVKSATLPEDGDDGKREENLRSRQNNKRSTKEETNKDGNGSTPTFLMENQQVKRRRRNNGST